MSVYAQLDCELLDFLEDLHMAEADNIPSEEEMDDMFEYYQIYYPELNEGWVMPF